jgi:regulator of protease activity HflC (stomatin/prohibitin superfamily)
MKRNGIPEDSSQSALFFRLTIAVTLLSSVFSVVCVYFGSFTEWFASQTFTIAAIPSVITSLYSFTILVLAFLKSKSAREAEDRILLERRKQSGRTFDTEEDVLFTARRTYENYKKYSEYVVAAFGSVLVASALVIIQRTWGNLGDVGTLPAKQAAFVSLVMAGAAILAGVFCIGQSRTSVFRWMRPVGVWFVLISLNLLLASLAMILKGNELASLDYFASRAFFALYSLLAAELFVNFIIEFYRPRTKFEDKPVFESRLLSVITEPGGILRNISDTLDYQFGFKVSGTWIYRFLERSIVPLLFVWLGLLWLATAFDEVPSGDLGVMEVFGARGTKTLSPGFYLKWPWPIARIRKFPVDRVQEIFIGSKLKTTGKGKNPPVVLWTQSHYDKEVKFLVATDRHFSERPTPAIISAVSKRASAATMVDEAPVSFITALLPVQFRIRPNELMNYAYGYKDPVKTLKLISERIITNYFASTDMLSVMSDGRDAAVKSITRSIREEADRMKLGVDIVAVLLLDAHPPIQDELPQAFQDVVAARERKESLILDAKKYKAATLPAAEADAIDIVSEAEAYKDDRIKVSKAESERFLKRLTGYNEMPEMYVLNEKMRFLRKDCANLRKYIVPSDTKNDVFVINLEEKRRLDLLDIGDLKETKPVNPEKP